MFEGPEEIKYIKKVFDTVLGANTTVKDNIKATESTVFEILIQKADDSLNLEDKLGEMDIDITKITDPLWFVIENQFKLISCDKLGIKIQPLNYGICVVSPKDQ